MANFTDYLRKIYRYKNTANDDKVFVQLNETNEPQSQIVSLTANYDQREVDLVQTFIAVDVTIPKARVVIGTCIPFY